MYALLPDPQPADTAAAHAKATQARTWSENGNAFDAKYACLLQGPMRTRFRLPRENAPNCTAGLVVVSSGLTNRADEWSGHWTA